MRYVEPVKRIEHTERNVPSFPHSSPVAIHCTIKCFLNGIQLYRIINFKKREDRQQISSQKKSMLPQYHTYEGGRGGEVNNMGTRIRVRFQNKQGRKDKPDN